MTEGKVLQSLLQMGYADKDVIGAIKHCSNPTDINCVVDYIETNNVSHKNIDLSMYPGWTQHYTNDGKIYYRDHNTKTTHWTLPARPIIQNTNNKNKQPANIMHDSNIAPSCPIIDDIKHDTTMQKDDTYWQQLLLECDLSGDYSKLMHEMENSDKIKTASINERNMIQQQITLTKQIQQNEHSTSTHYPQKHNTVSHFI
eukprot:175197_1